MPPREGFTIRPVEGKDLEIILAWRNSERIRAYMYTDHVITPEEHLRWFERTRSEGLPHPLLFEISGKPAGIVNFNRMDRANNACYWGFYLGDADAPRGCGTVMGFLGLEYIFEILKIRKVIGESFLFNQASIAFHERLGFFREGHLRRHILKNGEYQDILVFGLFADQWPDLKPELERKCRFDTDRP